MGVVFNAATSATSGEHLRGRRAIVERRKLGSYYTPRVLTDIMAAWAIRSATESILEPSFGGCEFINSAFARLNELGNPEPLRNIHGVDIDEFAFGVLKTSYPLADHRQFISADFLALEPSDLPLPKFNVVIGNPPYVRHHQLSDAQRKLGQRIRNRALPELTGQSNLWALFVLHSCSFLEDQGRAAWVLPQQFIQTSYSSFLRDFLRQRFERVTVISLDEHIFRQEGTWERTALLLAEGWSPKTSVSAEFAMLNASSVSELPKVLAFPGSVAHSDLCQADFAGSSKSIALDRLAAVQIGMVTGDAKFFAFDRAMATKHGISDKHLRLCVTKSSLLKGLTIDRRCLEEAFESGVKSALLDTTNGIDDNVARYLSLMLDDRIRKNATFKKRPIWHQPFQHVPCDGFYTGMSHISPRLALNPDGLDCTNTLYRVRFSGHLDDRQKKLVCLSVLSSFGQLSAEVVGKTYGSGLLKLEPSDVRKTLVFAEPRTSSTVEECFASAEIAARAGRHADATRIADFALTSQDFHSERELIQIRTKLRSLRKKRSFNA